MNDIGVWLQFCVHHLPATPHPPTCRQCVRSAAAVEETNSYPALHALKPQPLQAPIAYELHNATGTSKSFRLSPSSKARMPIFLGISYSSRPRKVAVMPFFGSKFQTKSSYEATTVMHKQPWAAGQQSAHQRIACRR